MSSLALSSAEEAAIDKNLEGMLSWAQTRKHEAEQLAMDASRLLSCTTDRVDRLSRQGFFTRCWSRFNGDAASAERANTGDLIQMQKVSLRYLNMLQEQQLLMAHSMLSLKNNLLSLAVKEEETRQLIALLAGRTLERFEKLENRVDKLEVSSNLQTWLYTLEDRDYDEKFPTEFMRMFRVINDFYGIKNDDWNYNDILFMRKALRTVGIDPKKKISLDCFIDSLVDEIQQDCVGFPAYAEAICQFTPQGVANYSRYAIDNISSPVFTTLHGLKIQFVDRLDIVEELQDEMNISAGEALKRLLRRSITGLNVNLNYEFPLAETAIEVLGCMRLAERLQGEPSTSNEQVAPQSDNERVEEINTAQHGQEELGTAQTPDVPVLDLANLRVSPWKVHNYTSKSGLFYLYGLRFFNDKWHMLSDDSLLVSNDLDKWTEEQDVDLGHGYRLVEESRKLFAVPNGILRAEPIIDLATGGALPLRNEFSGEKIRYDTILNDGNRWVVSGKLDISYSYTKSGFFSDSKETSSYYSAVLFTGNSLDTLTPYCFTQDFPMFNVGEQATCQGNILVLLDEESGEQRLLALSSDGQIWKKYPLISIVNGEEYDLSCYDKMIVFKDRLLFSDGNSFLFPYPKRGLFEFSFETGVFTKIETNLDIEQDGDYFTAFPEYGLLCYTGVNNALFLSTDAQSWQRIEAPFKAGKANSDGSFLALEGNKLVRFIANKDNLFGHKTGVDIYEIQLG